MKKFFMGIAAIVVFAAVAVAIFGGDKSPWAKRSDGTSQTPPMPADQAQFVGVVEKFITSYKGAANDMARGGERVARGKAICDVMRAPAVKDWIGTIDTLSSNNDGRGVLSVQISPNVRVETWNNAVSDAGDRTLIDPASPLFATVSAMKKHQWVRFAGTFFPGDQADCLRESSITQSGAMTEPEFLFRFSGIKAIE